MTRDTSQGWASGQVAAALAAVAATLLAAPLAASAASGGGTITFEGAITAPSLEVAASPAIPAMRVRTGNTQASDQAGVDLAFNSSPGVVSGADVALEVVGARPGDAVAARFVDSMGRAPAAREGHYRVGRDGGVLSMSPKRTGAQTPVIVVVSYD